MTGFVQKTYRGGGVWGAKLRLEPMTGVISKREDPATAIRLKSTGSPGKTS